MGKTNKCDLEEDECLAEEVRKYPCLYDKSDPGYKERDRKKNAWKAVEEAVGYEEGIRYYFHNTYHILISFYS